MDMMTKTIRDTGENRKEVCGVQQEFSLGRGEVLFAQTKGIEEREGGGEREREREGGGGGGGVGEERERTRTCTMYTI